MGQGGAKFGHWLEGGVSILHTFGGILDGVTGQEDAAKTQFEKAGHDFVRAWQGKAPDWTPSTAASKLQSKSQAALQEKFMELGSGNKLNTSLWQDGIGATNQMRQVANTPGMNGASKSSIAAISNPGVKTAIASSRGSTRGIVNSSLNVVDHQSLAPSTQPAGKVNNAGGATGPSTTMDQQEPQAGLQMPS